MRITMIDLQCEDIMWFAVDIHGRIFACTSAGEGNVPEFVCENRENVDFLEDFFLNELQINTKEQYCLPANKKNQLVCDFISLSGKGIYCFDSYVDDAMQRKYKKITTPANHISLDELPPKIKLLLAKNRIDVDVDISEYIVVPHAY